MISPSLQSLTDLSGIHIAYLMWIRRDVTKNYSKELIFVDLVDVVLNDVEGLPLPKKLKSVISKHVKPAGKHLLSLLNLWLPNIRPHGTLYQTYGHLLLKAVPENSQKWLTNDMLFQCLILNVDGMINPRKTAEKIISSRGLHGVLAFRLACINFLEKDVLELWMLVKDYFMNKIKQEGKQLSSPLTRPPIRFSHHLSVSMSQSFLFTTEPAEVLFWIAYCLSKENAIRIEEVPHFLGDRFEWYEFSLRLAAFSGNVACFDFLRDFCNTKSSSANIINKIFSSEEKDRQQPGFVFHFLLLNSEEKAELFQTRGREMMAQFLQWPLSLTFVQNPDRLWNLIPDKQKYFIFKEIANIALNENILLFSSLYGNDNLPSHYFLDIMPGTYSLEHLTELFVALWEISADVYKLHFLDAWLFEKLEYWRGLQEYRKNFLTSGLNEKLHKLFLSNGEAILELLEGENVKESLRKLIVKYMPQHFEELDNRCISLIEIQTVQPEIRKEMVKSRQMILISERMKRVPSNIVEPYYEKFLNFIKNV